MLVRRLSHITTTSKRDKTSRYELYTLYGGLARLLITLAISVIGVFSYVEISVSIITMFGLFLITGHLIARVFGVSSGNLFLIIYSASTIAAVVLYIIYMNRYGIPYYRGGSDDLWYELSAQDTVDQLGIFDYTLIRGNVVSQWHNSIGYVYLVSLLIRLSELLDGFHTMIPRLLNAMFLGITAVFSYRLACRLQLNKQDALISGLIVGLIPIMVYNTIHTFRDVLVALLLLIGVYLWTPSSSSHHSGSRIVRWALTLLLVLALSELRYYQSLVLIVVAFVGDTTASSKIPRNRSFYVFVVAIIVIGMLWNFRQELSELSRKLSEAQERYIVYRSDISDGLSNFIFGAPIWPYGFVLRFGYGLIYPLPVISPNVDRSFLSIGSLIQFLFLPFFIVGFTGAIGRRFAWPMFTAFILLFGGMTLFTFTDRHMVQYYAYGVILTVIGYRKYYRHRGLIWGMMVYSGFVLGILYIAIKGFA